MEKIDFNSALSDKLFKNFEGSKNDILRGLEQLEKNHRQGEFLDLNAREKILEAGYVLEAAVYRSIIYSTNCKKTMQTELQELNSALNRLAVETDHEFLKAFNLKVFALVSLFIIYEL